MAALAKDHVDAIRDELDNVFARPLVDACIAHMVTAREGEGDLVREGDTQTFEDTQEPFIIHEGGKYHRHGMTKKRVMTSFGAIDYERARYRRRAHRSVFPADRRLGLVEDFRAPGAARIALHMVSSPPPRECVRRFRQRGAMCPGVASPVRLHGAAGRRWEESAGDALATIREDGDVPREAAVATIRMDGVMVAMGQDRRGKGQAHGAVEWKEASCATVSPGTADGTPLRTVRYARMPEPNKTTLKRLVTDEVTSPVARRPDLRLVAVANGARDHWRYFSQTFPQAERVLDFFHAAENLKEAVDHAYGKHSDHGTRRWRTLRGVPLNEPDGVDRVITSLDYLRRHYAPAIDRTLGYFRNNRHRMRYASFGARGLIIGSGLVETRES